MVKCVAKMCKIKFLCIGMSMKAYTPGHLASIMVRGHKVKPQFLWPPSNQCADTAFF